MASNLQMESRLEIKGSGFEAFLAIVNHDVHINQFFAFFYRIVHEIQSHMIITETKWEKTCQEVQEPRTRFLFQIILLRLSISPSQWHFQSLIQGHKKVLHIRSKNFGSALWDMMRGRGTGYTMKGHVNVDTPFGAMKLPISKEGGTTRLNKNKDDEILDADVDVYGGS
nr:uncharacterized protein LOC104121048 [Nicotiana tomentosiformis]